MAKAPKRRTYHHGDLRNALIAASLEAIADDGVEAFTMRDAARRAGVSPGAPYRHFGDRDDLLAAVAADCAERLGAAMDAAAATASPGDVLAVFRASGVAYVRFAVAHPAHFRVMNLPAVAARMPPHARAGIEDWRTNARAGLLAAQQAGVIGSEPVDSILLAANCMVHGLAHLIVDGHAPFAGIDADQAAALADAVTGVFGVGLLPRVSSAAAADAAAGGAGTARRRRPRGGRRGRRRRAR